MKTSDEAEIEDAATRRRGDAAASADEPLAWCREHSDQLGHDLVIDVIELGKAFLIQITALSCEFEPDSRFFGLALGITQLTNKIRFVSALSPS